MHHGTDLFILKKGLTSGAGEWQSQDLNRGLSGSSKCSLVTAVSATRIWAFLDLRQTAFYSVSVQWWHCSTWYLRLSPGLLPVNPSSDLQFVCHPASNGLDESSKAGRLPEFLGISKKELSLWEATRGLPEGPGPISQRFYGGGTACRLKALDLATQGHILHTIVRERPTQESREQSPGTYNGKPWVGGLWEEPSQGW